MWGEVILLSVEASFNFSDDLTIIQPLHLELLTRTTGTLSLRQA